MTRLMRWLIVGVLFVCLPHDGRAEILWSADCEELTFAATDWNGTSGGYDGCWANGGATCITTTAQAHTGSRSCTMTRPATVSGARLAKTQTDSAPPLPVSAYYSSWLYYPSALTIPSWHMAMQWKRAPSVNGSDPILTLDIKTRSGAMYFILGDHVNHVDHTYNEFDTPTIASAPPGINIPIAQWFHLECLYTFATTDTGVIQCWQDGAELWHLTNRQTDYPYGTQPDGRPWQWTLANYSDNSSPVPFTVYSDDAAISTTRVGGAETTAPAAPTNLRVVPQP
jgi:hypothetical protein